MGLKALVTIHTRGGIFSPGQVLNLKNSKLTGEQAKELVDRGAAVPVDEDGKEVQIPEDPASKAKAKA